jgi:hypothetical protein
MRTGIPVKHHWHSLSDGELVVALDAVHVVYDMAPKFGAWAEDAIMAEQTRRLQSRDGVPRETELLELPSHQWTAVELAFGLKAVTHLSYGVRNEAVGKFVDRMVWAFTAAVGSRLIFAEGYISEREGSPA